MKITKILKPKIFIILVVLFVVATVVVNVQASALGAQLQSYQKQQEELSRQIEDLENDLVTLSSLSSKREKSEEYGLGNPTEIYYLKPQETFASR
ncbi:hypothetical protein ACFL2C_00255 [Patescibacteria group bacterium]